MPIVRYTDEALSAVERWNGILSAPSAQNRKTVGLQVFHNGVLERVFGTSHWATPALWFFPLIGWTLYRTATSKVVPAGAAAAIIVGGVLMWTLIEYILHRWVFHDEPKSPESKFRIFMMHGYHHEFPSDRLRLVAPPVMSWPIAAVVIPAYYLLLGPEWFAPITAGTIIGYLGYDWVHYYTHHARPTTRVGKFLRRYHMEHHFKDATTHFGLSSPLWDLVFGTYTRPAAPEQTEIDILGNADEGGFDGAGPVSSPSPAPASGARRLAAAPD